MAAAAGAALDLPLVGGSDSHHLATLGLGYTSFPGRTAEDLRYAIRMRMTRACGNYWRWAHSVEYVGLWLRSRAYRTPQTGGVLKVLFHRADKTGAPTNSGMASPDHRKGH